MKYVAVFLIGFFPYVPFWAVAHAIILRSGITPTDIFVIPVTLCILARLGLWYLLNRTDSSKLEKISQQLKAIHTPAHVINILAGTGFALSGVLMILSFPFIGVTVFARHLTKVLDQAAVQGKLQLCSGCPEKAVPVMREVAGWYREHGFRVWPAEWLTEKELLTDEAKPENFYIGTVNGQTACAFILQWSDREYWPEAPEYEAGYLHKLCVRRAFAHQNMTAQVVEALREECLRRGARYLRLDTGYDEPTVRDIYLAAGFEIVKTLERDGHPVMLLYELKL